MSERQKSQRGFVAVTLITLLAIAAVLIAYAALLRTIPGGEVTVGQIDATISYSLNNSTDWQANLYNVTGSWYARATFTSSYTGAVKITWQLEKKSDGTYGNVTDAYVVTSSYTIGSGVTVYASPSGNQNANQDWSSLTTGDGSYRIVMYVESTG